MAGRGHPNLREGSGVVGGPSAQKENVEVTLSRPPELLSVCHDYRLSEAKITCKVEVDVPGGGGMSGRVIDDGIETPRNSADHRCGPMIAHMHGQDGVRVSLEDGEEPPHQVAG